jgi:cytochrome c553
MNLHLVHTFAVCVFVSGYTLVAAAQDLTASRSLAASCFTCHGTDGNSSGGIPPSLAGRNSGELFQMMKDFQSGKRPATVMHQQARGYTDAQLKLIASYFESVKPTSARAPAKP